MWSESEPELRGAEKSAREGVFHGSSAFKGHCLWLTECQHWDPLLLAHRRWWCVWSPAPLKEGTHWDSYRAESMKRESALRSSPHTQHCQPFLGWLPAASISDSLFWCVSNSGLCGSHPEGLFVPALPGFQPELEMSQGRGSARVPLPKLCKIPQREA